MEIRILKNPFEFPGICSGKLKVSYLLVHLYFSTYGLKQQQRDGAEDTVVFRFTIPLVCGLNAFILSSVQLAIHSIYPN
jgi:hypothetical protein